MAAKPGKNYISGTLTDITEFGIFDDDELDKRLAK